ncbi:MAG: thiamine phosphate synthase [Planctomycetota bacterium]
MTHLSPLKITVNPLRSTYRILDAASNRVSEGLRTVEEYFRFIRDDESRASELKQFRHDFQLAVSCLSRRSLLDARDSDQDVGTNLSGDNEYERASHREVVIAASERIRQSLRVLEEYGKTLDVDFARQIEALRYRAYELFREIELSVLNSPRHARLADAQLYVLIDCQLTEPTWIETLRRWSEAGVDAFQLRDKNAEDRLLYERAVVGSKVAGECGSLFLVNDRVDLALASNADGVHLGQEELPLHAARSLLGSDRLIGISTHNVEQVHAAINGGADYLGCGPTFPSQTKSFGTHVGTDFLKQVHLETKRTPRPAFAIGGIGLSNLDQVLDSGFHRIAVTAAVNKAPDPLAAIAELKAKLRTP